MQPPPAEEIAQTIPESPAQTTPEPAGQSSEEAPVVAAQDQTRLATVRLPKLDDMPQNKKVARLQLMPVQPLGTGEAAAASSASAPTPQAPPVVAASQTALASSSAATSTPDEPKRFRPEYKGASTKTNPPATETPPVVAAALPPMPAFNLNLGDWGLGAAMPSFDLPPILLGQATVLSPLAAASAQTTPESEARPSQTPTGTPENQFEAFNQLCGNTLYPWQRPTTWSESPKDANPFCTSQAFWGTQPATPLPVAAASVQTSAETEGESPQPASQTKTTETASNQAPAASAPPPPPPPLPPQPAKPESHFPKDFILVGAFVALTAAAVLHRVSGTNNRTPGATLSYAKALGMCGVNHIRKNWDSMLISTGAGIGGRAAFAAAATAVTAHVAAASTLAIAAPWAVPLIGAVAVGALANVVVTKYKSRKDPTQLKGWGWIIKAAGQGALGGAIGGVLGEFAHHFIGGHLPSFHHHTAAASGAPSAPPAHPAAAGAHPELNHADATQTNTAPTSPAPTGNDAIVNNAKELLHDAVNKGVLDNDAALKALAERASNAGSSDAVLQHALKEVSFVELNKHPHDAAARFLGKKLVMAGDHVAEALKLHDSNSFMLKRDFKVLGLH